jgi:6-phosphogluconolactonase
MKTILALATTMIGLNLAAATNPDRMLVFIGTYTGGSSKGIYAYEFSVKDETLKSLGLAAEIASPSFLAIHPNKKFLYSVNEVGTGSITGFAIDAKKGTLARINDASSGGSGPCHLSVDQTGSYVLAANYGGGSVVSLPIDKDGKLGSAADFVQHSGSSINQQRQKEPHAHSINLAPDNRFALAADLGLDKILVYRFNPQNGSLKPNQPPFAATPAGGGPRHLAFARDGNSVFVNNEMLSSVTSYSYAPKTGTLKQKQTISTLPTDWKGNNSTAEIQAHPSGKFVYCSNRGHNSIAVFSVDSEGKMQHVENESTRGRTPRNFGIDPTGSYLIAANQDSDTLAIFRIIPATGELEPLGEPVAAPKPVCVKFLALE